MKLILAIVAALVFPSLAFAADGNIAITNFLAYYGEPGLVMTGPKVDSPMRVPYYLGSSSNDVASGMAKICGPKAQVRYHSIGQSGGGGHGFNVFVGACIEIQ